MNGATSPIARGYAEIFARAQSLGRGLKQSLVQFPDSAFTKFSAGNPLSDQLKYFSRLIAAGQSLGMRRQVFFATASGFDHHDRITVRHFEMLQQLDSALHSFHQTMQTLNMENSVTTFTSSEFGRKLAENGDGSDHGWGGMQFVLGGAVSGQQILGVPPEVGLGTKDDLGLGQLIPTTSTDQIGANLANWFGLPPSMMTSVFPNLANFPTDSWNLGLFDSQ